MNNKGLLDMLLDTNIFGNSLWSWLTALVLAALFFAIFKLIQKKAVAKLHSSAENARSSVIELTGALIGKANLYFMLLVAVWGSAALLLTITGKAAKLLDNAIIFVVFLQAGLWGNALINYLTLEKSKEAAAKDVAETSSFAALSVLAKAVLWIIVLLLILANFGIDVTALVAGLGIGGIAIALAVQNILGDLLCSVSILLDKPFEVGDFIIVDDKMGVVERIGIKSTRVKSISGEQLILANSDLIGSRIRNYKRMQERRIPLTIGVVYSTSPEQLKKIPAVLKNIIESREGTRFDRAHFKTLGTYSLDFEAIYFVESADYNLFMDIQQEINLQILQRFTELGIELAFPTQTLLLEQGENTAA